MPVDVCIPGTHIRVTAHDCLTGGEQEVVAESAAGATLVSGVLVKNYPVLVQVAGCVDA